MRSTNATLFCAAPGLAWVSETIRAAVNEDHDETFELDEWLGAVRIRLDGADITPASQKPVQMIVD